MNVGVYEFGFFVTSEKMVISIVCVNICKNLVKV
jgi:hypothetical protein